MNIEFITYIAAAFVVLLELGLVVLLISRKDNHSSSLYRTIVFFAVAVLLYCILYFYFYFQDVLLQDYSVALPLRLIDYLIDASIFFLWLCLLGRLMERIPGNNDKGIFRWAAAIGILRAAAGMSGACFMDEYYAFRSDTAGTTFIIAQAAITVLTIIVVGLYTLRLMRLDTSSRHRKYAGIVSILLCLWTLIQIIVDSFLYTGRFISAWAEGIPDTTAITVFLIGLSTFVFVFREDFSPLFYAVPGSSSAESSEDSAEPESLMDPLELAAAQHGLTVRELDVLRLVYEGKNNPEIAEALFISRNTVKKHLQSIYEKVGVNSRMELVYIVNLKEKK